MPATQALSAYSPSATRRKGNARHHNGGQHPKAQRGAVKVATDGKIKVIFEGAHERDGNLRLSDFANGLESLGGLLNRIDRQIYDGKATQELRVVDLSHSSPATVTIELAPESPGFVDNGPNITSRVFQIIDQIKNDLVMDYLGYEVLIAFRDLTKGLGKAVESLVLTSGDISADLDKQFARRVRELAETEDECTGEFEGTLEQINIHAGANTFRIYPYAGPTSVICRFKQKHLDEAKDAIGRAVCVYGILRYQPMANWPHEILVDEIEVFPPDDELPTFENLKGLAPLATGDQRSEDFVKDLRDEWTS